MTDETKRTQDDAALQDRYVRWTQIALKQMTYAIDLILGFAGATIGFEITLSLSDNFKLPQWAPSLYMLSLVTLGISMIFGVSAVVGRLWDFRVTRRIVWLEWKRPNDEELTKKRELDELLGRASWGLFYLQLTAFVLGVFLGAVVLFPFAASRAS